MQLAKCVQFDNVQNNAKWLRKWKRGAWPGSCLWFWQQNASEFHPPSIKVNAGGGWGSGDQELALPCDKQFAYTQPPPPTRPLPAAPRVPCGFQPRQRGHVSVPVYVRTSLCVPAPSLCVSVCLCLSLFTLLLLQNTHPHPQQQPHPDELHKYLSKNAAANEYLIPRTTDEQETWHWPLSIKVRHKGAQMGFWKIAK